MESLIFIQTISQLSYMEEWLKLVKNSQFCGKDIWICIIINFHKPDDPEPTALSIRASHHEATFSKSLAWVFFGAFLCLEMT